MSTIVTRAGKGSPLTNNEIDANVNNLNTDKAETSLFDQSVVSGATPNFGIANMTLDDTDLVVVDTTSLQAFADGVDHAILKDRGTGVTTTYVSTVAVGGTTFAQPAIVGEINSDQGYFSISYAGATGIAVSDLTAISTYVYIDNAGALQQQTTTPTRQDWSRKMFTMRISVDTTTNLIISFEYLNNPSGHYTNTMRDIYSYLLAQGIPFKKNQTVTGRAGDLGFDVSSGTLMELGGTGDINNANIRSFDAVSNASYQLLSKTARISSETNLVKYWDNAGTITALGSTTVVGHRLYRFSSGNFAMQYGQGNYANMVLAKAGVLLENYVLNPRLENATFFGWWFIESTATNTGGTTLTSFVEYTIGIQGGSSSSLAGCLLKGNNLSDLLDVSAARTNLGLGTAATTASTAYATAAQGALADAALPKAGGTMTGPLVLDNTGSVKVASGSTAQREASPTAGMFRYNTTDDKFEGYSTEWGELGGGAADLTPNSFTGDGSTVTYSLSSATLKNNTLVYVDGVYQNKATYEVSGANPAVVTFSTAPPNGTAIEIMVAAISVTDIGTPSDNTVTTAKIVNANVTTAKIADANVTTAKLADANVTTAKLADANVTTAKIADGAITTAKIADGSITTAKLAAGVGGAFNDFVIKTADYTAVTRDQLIVNSASARTITLPASPSAGNVVFIKNSGAGTVTVARNGSNINSTADDGELATDAGASLVFCDSTIGWKEL
jgi:hypothetical protein